MEKMSKSNLLAFITGVSFAIDDLILFLDTHPDCQEALESYNYYKELREKAAKEYAECYAPLSIYDVNDENYWSWVNGPWPWEGECDC